MVRSEYEHELAPRAVILARTIRFTEQKSRLYSPPAALEEFRIPPAADAADRKQWERFLRRTINFTYGCAAVAKVAIAGRGAGYKWRVELAEGNDPSWLTPFLDDLLDRIQAARAAGGKPPIESLTITKSREGNDVRDR